MGVGVRGKGAGRRRKKTGLRTRKGTESCVARRRGAGGLEGEREPSEEGQSAPGSESRKSKSKVLLYRNDAEAAISALSKGFRSAEIQLCAIIAAILLARAHMKHDIDGHFFHVPGQGLLAATLSRGTVAGCTAQAQAA